MPRPKGRFPHMMKKNTTLALPQECIWFDTESDQIQIKEKEKGHVLRFGFACYRTRKNAARTLKRARERGALGKTSQLSEEESWTKPLWLRFETVDQFWDWVDSRVHKGRCVTMFCHSAQFDVDILQSHMEPSKRGWKLVFAVLDRHPFIMAFTKDDRSIRIVDTMNFWNTSVAKLGEKIGLAKMEFPGPDATDEYWDAYCKRDVEVIMKACIDWFQFIRSEELGSFAETLAGQSMHAFCHRFMEPKIFIEAMPEPLAIARKAYYGGRTECFYIGQVPELLTALDYNSMYPAVMRDEKMPYRYAGHRSKGDLRLLTFLLDQFAVSAHVDLETWEPAYPVRWNHKIVFPVGRFDTWLTTPELQYALEKGHVRGVHEMVWHHQDVLFRDYVEYVWKQRAMAKQAGDEVRNHFFKIMINSFYGKWGQNGKKWKDIGEDVGPNQNLPWEVDAPTGEVFKYRRFANQRQELMKDEESTNSFPAIAAHVTAYARMRLWKTIVRAGQRNVYYCDTDSVYVNDTGLERLRHLIDEHELGALKVEKSEVDLLIRNLKDYRLNGKDRIKGISAKAREIAPGVYEQEQWSSIVGNLGRGRLGMPTTKTIIKTMERRYSKGVVTANKWVRPFVWGLLPEEQVELMTGSPSRLHELELMMAELRSRMTLSTQSLHTSQTEFRYGLESD